MLSVLSTWKIQEENLYKKHNLSTSKLSDKLVCDKFNLTLNKILQDFNVS